MSEIAQIKQVGETSGEQETTPHNIEAEQQLLGAILTNNDIYDRVAGVINEAHFYDPVHARIYEVAASRIATAGRGVAALITEAAVTCG